MPKREVGDVSVYRLGVKPFEVHISAQHRNLASAFGAEDLYIDRLSVVPPVVGAQPAAFAG